MSKLLFIIIGLALSSYSLSKELAVNESSSGLKEGEAVLLKVHGKPLYMYKVNEQDLENLNILDSHVFNSKRTPLVKEVGVFVVWAVSTKTRCLLKYMAPKTTTFGNTWLGGYYDPCGDVNYDISGRVIRTKEFTMNNYYNKYPNLKHPKAKHIEGTEIEIYNSGI